MRRPFSLSLRSYHVYKRRCLQKRNTFVLRWRKNKGRRIDQNTECVSLEDIASLTEDIYYLDKRTAFIVINEKYIKDGQEAVNERIITKTECESVYSYPILNTYDKGYATLAAPFACSR